MSYLQSLQKRLREWTRISTWGEPHKPDERSIRYNIVTQGGLLGLDTVIVAQLLSSDSLDIFLHTSTILFAAAIPLLAFSVWNEQSKLERMNIVTWSMDNHAATWGVFLSTFGIAVIFYHFSNLAGVIFTVIVYLLVHAHLSYLARLDRVNKDIDSQNK
ncbi:MAG: hypothetical protein H6632_12940 [Anaerolineales bacterium]|nr:hypothetical protein [Anaerolineales bacterium]